MPFNTPVRQLQQLIRKYLSGKASLPETAFLEKWYDHFDKTPESIAGEDAARESALLEAIHRRIDRQEQKVIPLYKGPLYQRALAKIAAVFLLLLTGSILWRQHTHHQKAPAPATLAIVSQDKPPGTDKAILTLASGQQVILGSNAHNSIPGQGNTNIIQLDSGSVTYQTAKDAHASPVYNTITTPAGGQYQVVLADGTRVWLNSASSLHFPTQFSAASRQVSLEGEGYFEVARDAAHPFRVKIDQMEVEVLGTSFNIMAYRNEGQSRTTLVDGSVKLIKGNNSSLLQPGQQGFVNEERGSFSIANADLEEVLAWKEGKFRFVNADIATIMRQIARWYDIEVVYKGTLPQKRLSGAFPRKQNVTHLFEALEDVSDVHFDMTGNTVTVTAGNK